MEGVVSALRIVCAEMLWHAESVLGECECVDVLRRLYEQDDAQLVKASRVFNCVYRSAIVSWADAARADTALVS